jgi:5-methylcytosine-specific restriction protein A
LPKIGSEEIKAAYSLSKDVAAGKLTDSQAADLLQKSFGMNYSSAWGYLRKRRQMLAGEQYTRTMNIAATRYFLENIYQDEGEVGLLSALLSVRKHAQYYAEQGKSSLPSIIALADQLQNELLSSDRVESDAVWQQSVATSYALPLVERQRKLPSAGHKPAQIVTSTRVYVRSPHVVAARLLHSNGICEDCKAPAPFKRKSNGLPYLEVHHRVTLADGGDDTFENSIALCPNCHRQRHYG